MLASF